MKERKVEFTREEAKKAVRDAKWAMRVGAGWAATSIWLTQVEVPVGLKIITFGGLIVSGVNAAGRVREEGRAIQEYPGIEKER